ncbi:hypothetical protein GCM10010293_40490 [Streptomyces griseoflavus]|uniref:DUF6197 family protein n=1 Tax=Streptomyces griseoflavus TaxID=35619 RepID=UPI00167DA021|nr:hypothetical protein [Streptomyces griseoflavus]GGV36912.1 hypothetical protein GCM10010293_40490 [Streptomyces griseoflavus]
MTTTITRPTPAALDLETRLALVEAAMTARLDQAAVAFEVNTAHLPGADPVPAAPTEVVPLAPTAAPSPYSTPIADLLHRARIRLETDGWCRDALYDEDGAICPIRAIRLEAHGARSLADDACVLLLDRIQADFPGAETIPSWNATQTSSQPVLQAFDRAAHHAHTRDI